MPFDKTALLLYAVTDRSWCADAQNGESSLETQVEQALRGGVTCVQLREKNLAPPEIVRAAYPIRALAAAYGVPFIINDSVDAAIVCGADGVHVGQGDIDAAQARRRLGSGKILGVSAQTVEQAIRAQDAGADYLGVGAVFPTDTKQDADYVAFATLQAICRAVSIPVVAIGGIHETNAARLEGSGIAGISVVSALFASPDIRRAAARLRVCAEEIVCGRKS